MQKLIVVMEDFNECKSKKSARTTCLRKCDDRGDKLGKKITIKSLATSSASNIQTGWTSGEVQTIKPENRLYSFQHKIQKCSLGDCSRFFYNDHR